MCMTIGQLCEELAERVTGDACAVMTSYGLFDVEERQVVDEDQQIYTTLRARRAAHGSGWSFEITWLGPLGGTSDRTLASELSQLGSISALLAELHLVDWASRPTEVTAGGRTWKCVYERADGKALAVVGALFCGAGTAMTLEYERAVAAPHDRPAPSRWNGGSE